MIEPQLAASADSIEGKEHWAMEPKYDGIRLLAHKRGDSVILYTRNQLEQTEKFPQLVEAIKKIKRDVTLDGEIIFSGKTVEINHQLVPVSSFESTLSVVGSSIDVALAKQKDTPLVYVVFDCVEYGKSLQNIPDVLRRKGLEQLVREIDSDDIIITPRWEGWSEDTYNKIIDEGGEGIILKNQLVPYVPGSRSTNTWLKIKSTSTADVVVMGYKPGQGKFKDLVGAIEFGQFKGNKLVARSRCSGMSYKERINFTNNGASFLGKVMEIKYNGRVGDGSFRHPQYLRVREDKKPEECVWE